MWYYTMEERLQAIEKASRSEGFVLIPAVDTTAMSETMIRKYEIFEKYVRQYAKDKRYRNLSDKERRNLARQAAAREWEQTQDAILA